MPSTLEKKILAKQEELEKRIEELELVGKTKIVVPPKETTSVTPAPPPITIGIDTTFPVPSEYRTAVNEILSDKFGLRVIPLADRPAFEFQIFVPKEYSNAEEAVWKSYKCDMRSKILTYGEGLLGVKTYLDLIKKNLGPDINAKIEADKKNGN